MSVAKKLSRLFSVDQSQGYMPRELFEFGAASVASVNLRQPEKITIFVRKIEEGYRESYLDKDVGRKMLEAAEALVQTAREELPRFNFSEKDLPSLLHTFGQFVIKYDLKGKRRPWRLFNGTKYNKESAEPKGRVNDIKVSFHLFLVFAQAGKIKL